VPSHCQVVARRDEIWCRPSHVRPWPQVLRTDGSEHLPSQQPDSDECRRKNGMLSACFTLAIQDSIVGISTPSEYGIDSEEWRGPASVLIASVQRVIWSDRAEARHQVPQLRASPFRDHQLDPTRSVSPGGQHGNDVHRPSRYLRFIMRRGTFLPSRTSLLG